MAEAAVLDAEITPHLPPEDAEPPVKKKFGGKQDGAGRPSNEKLEKDREHDPRTFAELQASLTDADWEKHIIYVWRRDPWYDTTNGGRDVKYIGVSSTAVTEESLKKDYGSGTYKVQLNRGDKPIAHVIYTILDEKYPPALPPGDWLDHPKNKKWQHWRPLIDARWKSRVTEIVGAPPAQGGDVEALTKLIQKLVERETGKPAASSENEKLTSTLVTWALQQTTEQRKVERETDSPSKMVDMMTGMIKAIKELTPAPPPPPAPPPEKKEMDPVVTLILTGLRDDLKAAREEAKAERETSRKLMEKILDAKAEQVSPLAQIETLGNVIMKFGEITGKVSGPRDWKDGIVDAVSEVLPKAVDLGQAYLTQKALTDRQKLTAAAAANANRPGAPATPAPAALPPATTTAPPAATAAPSTTTTEAAAPAPDQPPQQEMDVTERTQIMYMASQAAQALNLGLKGDQFAEQICVLHGDQAFEDFVAHFQKDALVDKVKAVPEAWNMLAPHEARLAQFIEAFYSFAESDDEPDDEPAPAPAPAKKPAAGKPAAKGKKK